MYKYLLILLSFITCQSKTTDFKNEINRLDTPEKQSKFLEDIYDLDQSVRKESRKIEQQYGYNSNEHKKSIEQWIEADKINQKKVEYYLEKYGHPDLNIHTQKATGTPWIVIHHSPDGYEARLRNFPYLYKAYVKGDLDPDTFAFFLNRMYSTKFGERIEWDGPFTTGIELDTLFKTLELYPLIAKIKSH